MAVAADSFPAGIDTVRRFRHQVEAGRGAVAVIYSRTAYRMNLADRAVHLDGSQSRFGGARALESLDGAGLDGHVHRTVSSSWWCKMIGSSGPILVSVTQDVATRRAVHARRQHSTHFRSVMVSTFFPKTIGLAAFPFF